MLTFVQVSFVLSFLFCATGCGAVAYDAARRHRAMQSLFSATLAIANMLCFGLMWLVLFA